MFNAHSNHWKDVSLKQPCHTVLVSRCSRIARFLLVMLLPLAPFTFATAMERQSTAKIKASVKQFLDDNIEVNTDSEISVKIGTIDPRLNLSRCSDPLEPFNKRTGDLSGNITVGVRCHTPKRWTIYVPVEINVYEHVIASARPLAKGQVITSQAIKTIKLRTSHKNVAYYKNPKYVVGMVASRNMGPGKVITPRLIQAPTLVKRGEAVILLAETPHLTVRMKGKAMQDGAMGELIKVRNISSNRVIEGTVAKTGVVEVTM